MSILLVLSSAALGQEAPAASADPASQAPAAQAPVDHRREAPLRIVYTGARGGIGAGQYPLSTLRHIQPDLTEAVAFHGTLAQGDWLLRTADRTVASVVRFLRSGGITCGQPAAVPVLESEVDIAIPDSPGDSALLESIAARAGGETAQVSMRQCVSADGTAATLLGPGAAEPDWALSAFEFRLALGLTLTDGTAMTLTGRPIQEGSRTFQRLTALLEADPEAVYVDAGSFVDGASSVEDGALSLHRPLGYRMLERLSPDALAPGLTELIAGPAVFFAEQEDRALPYIASNWQADSEAMALPPYRLVTRGDRTVAFVAMLDPALHQLIPALAAAGVQITDPIAGVQAVVDALHAEHSPDAVVLLTSASAAVMAEARRRLRGVDLMVGDPTLATLRVQSETVELRPLGADTKGAPLTLSLDGIATVALQFADGAQGEDALLSVRTEPVLVRGKMPTDGEVTAAITATRAAAYPALEALLLPAFSGAAPLDEQTWSALICEAVRQATDADSVFLRPLPPPSSIPGPMTALRMVNQLAMLDVLQVHQVPGTKMAEVLDRAYGMELVSCGATSSNKKAWGRSLESDRIYRVVSTDRTVASSPIGGVLSATYGTRLLDGPGVETLSSPSGHPQTLRATALRTLQGVRDDGGGPEAVATWLAQAPSAVPPQWLLRLRQLDLQMVRFQGTENDAFAEVPETLATSPSSFTLGSEADVALDYSRATLASDLRFRSSFTTQSTADSEPTESADDWRLSTSISLPGVLIPAQGALRFMPYSELLYDSEYTPTVDDAGLANPRQADLSLTAGLSAKAVGMLKTLRVGGFASQDLAQLGDKSTEFGGKMEWATSKSFSTALIWSTEGDLSVYGDTPEDDASDLRFRGFAESRLSLPLARYLDVGLYVQGFALQGRVPANDELGMSWTLGAALDMGGVFAL